MTRAPQDGTRAPRMPQAARASGTPSDAHASGSDLRGHAGSGSDHANHAAQLATDRPPLSNGAGFTPTATAVRGVAAANWRRAKRWLRRTFCIASLTAVVTTLGLAAYLLCFPIPPSELSAGGTPLIFRDRHGEVFATLPPAGAQRPTSGQPTTLSEVPAIALAAVITSEDATFWDHYGVSPTGIARALWLNARARRAAYGGSTLTQQVARLMLSPGRARGWRTKAREAIYALRLERSFDKRTILAQWFARAYFGNGAWGYHAAAHTYFGKPPHALTTGEATLLAILPRAPSHYDLRRNLAGAIARRNHVLMLMVKRGQLTASAAADAQAEIIELAAPPPQTPVSQLTEWLRNDLPLTVQQRGGIVETTLDMGLQRQLAAAAATHVAQFAAHGMQQAALVVLDTATGEVRAMIGAAAANGPGHALNLALRRRHPGSAVKPFIYALSIAAGAGPASIAWDVRDAQQEYINLHGSVEHGPTRYRNALASSYNFAAVDVLATVGMGPTMSLLRRAGVADLDGSASDYGLRLALGAGKTRLLDLAAGYGFLVNAGFVVRPHGIVRVRDVSPTTGATSDATRQASLASARVSWQPTTPPATQVLDEQSAWLTMDILADPEARRPGFGYETPFDLPFRVAAKTGTARGFADTWAVAVTREYTVAVWAGTIDGTPMQHTAGMSGAGPLARTALLHLAARGPLTLPPPPPGLVEVEVCAISGGAPGPHCPRVHDHARASTAAAHPEPCTWHVVGANGAPMLRYPTRAAAWLKRRSNSTPGTR